MWEFVLMQQLFILHLFLKLSSSSPGRNVHDETGKPGKDCLKYCKDPPSIWAMGGDKSDFCHVALLCPQAILKTPWFDESQAIPVLVQSCADVWQCLEGMVETAKPSLIFFFLCIQYRFYMHKWSFPSLPDFIAVLCACRQSFIINLSNYCSNLLLINNLCYYSHLLEQMLWFQTRHQCESFTVQLPLAFNFWGQHHSWKVTHSDLCFHF